MHRAHVDDAATFAGSQHVAHTGPRGEEGPVEMDGHHLLPVRERKAFDRMHDLDTGVADEDIHTTVGGSHFFHALLHLSLVGYIHCDGHRLALGLDDFLRDRSGRRFVQVSDRDLAAFPREGERDLFAYAACGAGDNGNLVLQAHSTVGLFVRTHWTSPRLESRIVR